MELDKEQEAQQLEERRLQEQIAKFEEKCKGLLALAKKKEECVRLPRDNGLFFWIQTFEADKMEKVFEFWK